MVFTVKIGAAWISSPINFDGSEKPRANSGLNIKLLCELYVQAQL